MQWNPNEIRHLFNQDNVVGPSYIIVSLKCGHLTNQDTFGFPIERFLSITVLSQLCIGMFMVCVLVVVCVG